MALDYVNILSTLITELKIVDSTTSYPKSPGIYTWAIKDRPTVKSELLNKMASSTLLYLGKSETSLFKRIVKTHLNRTKTGSSTLRRSLGAILRSELSLTPMPRSFTETTERRYGNFRFTPDGEDRLTDWMTSNLMVSVWKYPKLIESLEEVEANLISISNPPLNLYPSNDFRSIVISIRAELQNQVTANLQVSIQRINFSFFRNLRIFRVFFSDERPLPSV